MGTMCILARLGVREEVLAAALLHDYLEDVPDPEGRQRIRSLMGEEVLGLVLEVTENKRREADETATWEVRKLEQIQHVEQMLREAVLIKGADTLHNLQSLLADLDSSIDLGDVWKRFNAGPERQLWYFSSLIGAVGHRLGEHRLVSELEDAAERLAAFVPA